MGSKISENIKSKLWIVQYIHVKVLDQDLSPCSQSTLGCLRPRKSPMISISFYWNLCRCIYKKALNHSESTTTRYHDFFSVIKHAGTYILVYIRTPRFSKNENMGSGILKSKEYLYFVRMYCILDEFKGFGRLRTWALFKH